jgi:hypothetical protein
MPSPRTHPHADKIDTDPRNDPDVPRLAYRLPKLPEFQTAHRQPDKKDADQNPEPELPFFHAEDCIILKT